MARQDIKKTGWPAGLLQDDDARLSRWFASRPDARYVLKRNLEKDMNEKPTYFTDNHAAGMTLRDYFAAKASEQDVKHYEQGEGKEISGTDTLGQKWTRLEIIYYTREQAKYRYADAMMKAREQ